MQSREHQPVSKTSPAGWIVCLFLLAALAAVAWYAWRTVKADVPSEQPQHSIANEEKAKLAEETKSLETARQAMLDMLKADPCSIPEQVQGYSLLPGRQDRPEEQSKTPASSPPLPMTPPTQPAASAEPETIATNAEIEAATTLILTKEGMGTGFFISPGIVVTNRHVVEAAPDLIILVSEALGGLTPGQLIAMSQKEGQDYALIKVSQKAKPLPAPLTLCGNVRKTEKVGAWGYPGALSVGDPKFNALINGDATAVPEQIYSEGVVNVVYETDPPLILHTADISHGNSGGPLVNNRGCVVGINTMIHMDQESYRQTGISLSSSDLVNFLRQHGVSVRYEEGKK